MYRVEDLQDGMGKGWLLAQHLPPDLTHNAHHWEQYLWGMEENTGTHSIPTHQLEKQALCKQYKQNGCFTLLLISLSAKPMCTLDLRNIHRNV